MTAQVLFFDVLSEKEPHLNAVEFGSCLLGVEFFIIFFTDWRMPLGLLEYFDFYHQFI